MKNKVLLAVIAVIFLFPSLLLEKQVEAATTYSGEFVSFSYKEGTPVSMIIIDNNGKRVKHNLASSIAYKANGRITNANTIKNGMKVTFNKTGNSVTELSGVLNITTNTMNTASYQLNGIVTKIDPNGMFLTVKPDTASEQSYYINKNTRFLKGSTLADLSMLYEGDRIKMRFTAATTSTISEIEIINAGILIENVYKGTLKTADAYRNTFTASNIQPFEDWLFGTSVSEAMKSFSFTNETSVFAGNQSIKKEELKHYLDKEFYFVTIKQFGKEVVKKVVVLLDFERTYYDSFKSVNTSYSLMNFNRSGNMYYHGGSILIRNGRLIEPTSLTSYGTAHIITDGVTRGSYAHVVNVTNDGFIAPNLANHDLYFGELALVDTDNYLLEINDAVRLTNNYWKAENAPILAFSNGTSANFNYNSQVIKLIPNLDLFEYETYYGYFYVKNGHVQALHLLDPSAEKTSRVLTGTISTVSGTVSTSIGLKNVSQWQNGGWTESGATQNINLTQTMILKNGKAITASQLKPSDRVVLFTTASLNAHILLVNE